MAKVNPLTTLLGNLDAQLPLQNACTQTCPAWRINNKKSMGGHKAKIHGIHQWDTPLAAEGADRSLC